MPQKKQKRKWARGQDPQAFGEKQCPGNKHLSTIFMFRSGDSVRPEGFMRSIIFPTLLLGLAPHWFLSGSAEDTVAEGVRVSKRLKGAQ